MIRTIQTTGTDIHVLERPGGGYVVQQGKSHLLLTESEAAQLTAVLGELLHMPKTTSPAKARLQRYPITNNQEST